LLRFKEKRGDQWLLDRWVLKFSITTYWTRTVSGVKTLIKGNERMKRNSNRFNNTNRLKTKSSLSKTLCNNNLFKLQKKGKKESRNIKRRKWLNRCICKQWVISSILSLKLDLRIWEWSSCIYQTLSEQRLIKLWLKWVCGTLGTRTYCIKLLRKKIHLKRWKSLHILWTLNKLCLIDDKEVRISNWSQSYLQLVKTKRF